MAKKQQKTLSPLNRLAGQYGLAKPYKYTKADKKNAKAAFEARRPQKTNKAKVKVKPALAPGLMHNKWAIGAGAGAGAAGLAGLGYMAYSDNKREPMAKGLPSVMRGAKGKPTLKRIQNPFGTPAEKKYLKATGGRIKSQQLSNWRANLMG